METLGYGSLLIVDGYGAAPERLGDEAYARGTLGALVQQLGIGATHALTVGQPFEGGVSAGVALPESHLTLHTFRARRCVCLSIFSRQEPFFGGVLAGFKGRFQIGRLESHLSSRSAALPQDAARALSYLLGERNYTDVRLGDTLLVP